VHMAFCGGNGDNFYGNIPDRQLGAKPVVILTSNVLIRGVCGLGLGCGCWHGARSAWRSWGLSLMRRRDRPSAKWSRIFRLYGREDRWQNGYNKWR
jgi:hypothetical protein